MTTQNQLASGLGGAIGSDFRSTLNQLLFVEYAGKLSRLNLTRTATVIYSGNKLLLSSYGIDLNTGTEEVHAGPVIGDIQWLSVEPQGMYPNFSAQLVGLGVLSAAQFAAITADTLQSLTYSTAYIPQAKFVSGYAFAVLTNGGNYAKVQVTPQGLNLQLQWITYKLQPAYEVLGTGYTEPEDVKGSSDGVHAYVTERSGDLVKVALASANRSAATTSVIVSGMTAPQQMFLDEAHQTAYVVEYAPSGTLWKINLAANTKTAVVTGLQNAVGVVISADLQYAYISEQTTGPDLGRVSKFQLSNGSRTPIVKGLTAPFFLTWLDAAQTSILVPQRDPSNSVVLINVSAGTYQTVVTGTPNRPSSVAQTGTGQILICTDTTIVETSLTTSMSTSGPLLMGIGFVPFDKINTSGTYNGYANTAVDPTYFYQVSNVPFAGTLPIMIDYMAALNIHAAYYRVTTTSPSSSTPAAQNINWTDEHWNGTQFVADTTVAAVVGGLSDCYPVRALSDLFNWMNPSLGGFLDSTALPEGFNTITVTFLNATGGVVGTATPLKIFVDNNPCTATIGQPILHGVSADTVCGLLHYGIKDTSPVTIAFTASQPNNNATFSFDVVKGVSQIDSISGAVSVAASKSPFSDGVADLLGTCSIAGYAAEIYVAASAINGWGRQSQYDASAVIAFVLAP